MRSTLLIVDDTPVNRVILKQALTNSGADIYTCESGEEALKFVEKTIPDLILLDISMPGIDGFEVCKRIKTNEHTQDIPIIFLSALEEVSTKVKGFDLGAVDYITKPFNVKEVNARVKTQLTISSLQQEMRHKIKVTEEILKEEKARQDGPLLGNSPAVKELRQKIELASSSNDNILLYSDSGCGEENIARTIHKRSSTNGGGFIYVNCSQINKKNWHTIINDDPSGESKFNLAIGGTLYLDHASELSIILQVKFFTAYEYFRHTSNRGMRIICHSTKNIESQLKSKKIIQSFYDLISSRLIHIPSLAKRKEDLAVLAEHYIKGMSSLYGKNVNSISPESIEIMSNYQWPGNLRELKNIIERQLVISHDSILNIPESALNKGEGVGGYHLINKIASGGMGEVWKAEHRFISRLAAIKFISSQEVSNRQNLASFFREAQATANLSSPHTVSLFDFGTRENGSFYYVMELLQGLDLSEMIDCHGSVSPQRAVHFLKQCCYSLIEAHEKGLVHRDIKPANIFACRLEPHYDFIKLLDFGIVKELNNTDHVSEGLVGTPPFMSPEMFDKNASIDAKSDIYSLACVAYFILGDKYLFESKSIKEYCYKHLNSAPPPIRKFTDDFEIPTTLENLLLRCLNKTPNKRPSAIELLSELMEIDVAPWSYKEAKEWWHEYDYEIKNKKRLADYKDIETQLLETRQA